MSSNEENERAGWYYLAVKKISALLCRKTPNDDCNFCLNCLHSFRTKNKLKSHEKACKDKDFCSTKMPSEKNKTSKLNPQKKLEKTPYGINVNIECLVKNIDSCENIPQISSSTKISKHMPRGYLLSTIWGFDHIQNKYSFYRGKDCMK